MGEASKPVLTQGDAAAQVDAPEEAAVQNSVDVQESEEASKVGLTQGETDTKLEAPSGEVAAVNDVHVQQAMEAGKAEGEVAAAADAEVTEGAVVNQTCGWLC